MAETSATERWSADRARAWAARTPWLCGCNFLPSTAVNFLEMWRRETFDPGTIERELGFAARVGMNALRTNLSFTVWRHDPDGHFERFERLLDAAEMAGLLVVPCLFDDCGFGGREPIHAAQPDPVPGVHNSRAVASPGREALLDRNNWPAFEDYARGVVSRHRGDPRIVLWDLYNEPGNRMVFTEDGYREDPNETAPHALALLRAVFAWARAENPVQPLTVAAWRASDAEPFADAIDHTAIELSDVVSFHAYLDASRTSELIDALSAPERPLLLTEWMARAMGSRIGDQLPLLRRRTAGAFQWGLVRGRTQTHLPWPAPLVAENGGEESNGEWFHDLLHPNGTPYDRDEVRLLAGTR